MLEGTILDFEETLRDLESVLDSMDNPNPPKPKAMDTFSQMKAFDIAQTKALSTTTKTPVSTTTKTPSTTTKTPVSTTKSHITVETFPITKTPTQKKTPVSTTTTKTPVSTTTTKTSVSTTTTKTPSTTTKTPSTTTKTPSTTSTSQASRKLKTPQDAKGFEMQEALKQRSDQMARDMAAAKIATDRIDARKKAKDIEDKKKAKDIEDKRVEEEEEEKKRVRKQSDDASKKVVERTRSKSLVQDFTSTSQKDTDTIPKKVPKPPRAKVLIPKPIKVPKPRAPPKKKGKKGKKIVSSEEEEEEDVVMEEVIEKQEDVVKEKGDKKRKASSEDEVPVKRKNIKKKRQVLEDVHDPIQEFSSTPTPPKKQDIPQDILENVYVDTNSPNSEEDKLYIPVSPSIDSCCNLMYRTKDKGCKTHCFGDHHEKTGRRSIGDGKERRLQ